MLNSSYIELIRQRELKNEYEIDDVGIMEEMGGLGRRVERSDEVQEDLDQPVKARKEQQVPALVEIYASGDKRGSGSLNIQTNEYEPVPDGAEELVGQIVGGVPEGD